MYLHVPVWPVSVGLLLRFRHLRRRELQVLLHQLHQDHHDFATCFSTTVLGGASNFALNSYDAVGGGQSNQAGFLTSDSTGIGSGDQYNVVVGGNINTVGGSYSSVTGGYDNFAFGVANVVGGGAVNTVSSGSKNAWSKTMKYAVIGGGKTNKVTADYGVVVGGGVGGEDVRGRRRLTDRPEGLRGPVLAQSARYAREVVCVGATPRSAGCGRGSRQRAAESG